MVVFALVFWVGPSCSIFKTHVAYLSLNLSEKQLNEKL